MQRFAQHVLKAGVWAPAVLLVVWLVATPLLDALAWPNEWSESDWSLAVSAVGLAASLSAVCLGWMAKRQVKRRIDGNRLLGLLAELAAIGYVVEVTTTQGAMREHCARWRSTASKASGLMTDATADQTELVTRLTKGRTMMHESVKMLDRGANLRDACSRMIEEVREVTDLVNAYRTRAEADPE